MLILNFIIGLIMVICAVWAIVLEFTHIGWNEFYPGKYFIIPAIIFIAGYVGLTLIDKFL